MCYCAGLEISSLQGGEINKANTVKAMTSRKVKITLTSSKFTFSQVQDHIVKMEVEEATSKREKKKKQTPL